MADEFDGNKEMRREGIRKALAKLESVMPAKGNSSSSCIPSICIGMSITKFPIPSPVPSISLFITWPFSMSACNGMNLREEIAEIKEAGGAGVAARLDEAEGSGPELSGGGSHGMSFGVFPVPEAAYFAMGTGRLSWMSGARKFADEKGLSRILAADAARIDKLMLNAMAECPETWDRFVAHGKALGKDPRGSAADRRSRGRSPSSAPSSLVDAVALASAVGYTARYLSSGSPRGPSVAAASRVGPSERSSEAALHGRRSFRNGTVALCQIWTF